MSLKVSNARCTLVKQFEVPESIPGFGKDEIPKSLTVSILSCVGFIYSQSRTSAETSAALGETAFSQLFNVLFSFPSLYC